MGTSDERKRRSQNFWLRNFYPHSPPPKKIYFWVISNHPALHSGGVSGGGSVAVADGVSDMLQVIRNTLLVTEHTLFYFSFLFFLWCYYPNTSNDSVSPVCGAF